MSHSGTIGIIGGGQLGMMLTQAALPLGFKVIVLDPSPNSPASQVGAQQITKPYDKSALSELASQSDYLTTEFEEGLDLETLEHLQTSGFKLHPPPQTLTRIVDKLMQKDFLSEKGIPMGQYEAVNSPEDAYVLLKKYGGKMLIKTRRGGYDGYGNRLVSSREDIQKALADFTDEAIYAEAFIPFIKELAVMVARSDKGEIATYPVVETIQKNNICHEVLAPADVSRAVEEQALEVASKVASSFEGAGVFGIEMFLTDEGKVLLNEIAPRVHNSGHYTIEACETSQFEQHIRAITGMPLGPTDMKVPAAVMINLLGERNGEANPKGLDKARQNPHTYIHIYGKSRTKIGRKMAHITVTADSPAEAEQIAKKSLAEISI